MHWASLWGKSPKAVREWFREEFGPGICVNLALAGGRSAITSRDLRRRGGTHDCGAWEPNSDFSAPGV
jgi:hypothetical protein